MNLSGRKDQSSNRQSRFFIALTVCTSILFIWAIYYYLKVVFGDSKIAIFEFHHIIFILVVLALIVVYGYSITRIYQRGKKFQQAFNSKSAELEHFFNNSIDLLCIADTKGYFRRLNPEWKRVLGYDILELEGRPFIEFVHPEDIDSTIDATNRLAGNQKISSFINRYRHKDGSYRWIEWRSFPVGDFIYASARDITERKITEEEIRKKELWLRESQHNSHIGSYNFDIVQDAWKNSEELDVIFGIPADYDKSSKGWITLIHPDYQQVMADHLLKHVIEERNPFNKEYQIVRQNDGEVRWVHGLGNLNFDKNGNPVQMIGTIQDITEQKNAQEEILIKELRFRTIFENSSLGVAIVGLDGKYLMVNTAICQIMGYSSEELLNMTFYQLTHPDDMNKSNDVMESLIKGSSININFTKRYIHKDGRIIWVDINSRLLNGSDNKPLYYITHINDITERKIAEDLKKENEEKFRIAFDNSPTGMSMIRPDGHYVAVNQMLCNMFGYTAEELLNGTINKITHPDDIERSYQWIRKKISGDESEPEFEKRFIHRDGHIVWGLLRSQWMRNEDGTPRLSVTHVLDITERKKAEEEIRQSEKKYHLLFENMTSGFALHQMIYDNEGNPYDYRYLEANPAFYTLTGIPQGIMTGKTVREVLPNIEEHWIQTFSKVALTGEPLYYMNFAQDLGRYYETFVFSPEKNKFAVMFNDATDRVKAENELKASEERFFMAFKTSPDSVNINRLSDGTYIEVNEGFLAILGYSAEEALGRTSIDLNIWVNPEDRQRLVQGLLSSNMVSNLEAQFRKKNGEVIVGLMSAAIITLQGEKCILSITRDISDRKKAEEEIIKLNSELEQRVIERTSQLEQANKDLESFAYSVSHDLRAPIRHIDGFLKLLYSNIQSPSENITDYYEKINVASRRMSGMIDELLTFSRLGRKDLTLSTVNMNVIIDEIIEQFKPDIALRQIKWEIRPLPTIPVDHNLIKIAFENLISNAIKYTSKKELANIEIGCIEETYDKAVFYVKDNGEGFDMKFANKLFGVFQRLHKPEDFEGIGIGLANVKQIVTKHKGTITAQAEVNEGATFFITLPK